jgi:hypothetical protein
VGILADRRLLHLRSLIAFFSTLFLARRASYIKGCCFWRAGNGTVINVLQLGDFSESIDVVCMKFRQLRSRPSQLFDDAAPFQNRFLGNPVYSSYKKRCDISYIQSQHRAKNVLTDPSTRSKLRFQQLSAVEFDTHRNS